MVGMSTCVPGYITLSQPIQISVLPVQCATLGPVCCSKRCVTSYTWASLLQYTLCDQLHLGQSVAEYTLCDQLHLGQSVAVHAV